MVDTPDPDNLLDIGRAIIRQRDEAIERAEEATAAQKRAEYMLGMIDEVSDKVRKTYETRWSEVDDFVKEWLKYRGTNRGVTIVDDFVEKIIEIDKQDNKQESKQ